MSREIAFAGGSAEALTAAAYCARGGRPALVRAPARLARELASESFLSPFRFDLDLGFLLRGPEGADAIEDLDLAALGLRMSEPEVPLAVTFAGREPFLLHRDWQRTLEAAGGEAGAVERMLADGRIAQAALLGAGGAEAEGLAARLSAATVAEALDRYGIAAAELRCALTCLPLAFGLAPDVPASGLTLALLAAGLERFTVVTVGMGALAAALADRVLADGGSLVEAAEAGAEPSAGDVVGPPPAPGPPATAGFGRLYLGIAGDAPRAPGHVTVVGLESEAAIYSHLAAARAGRVPAPAGHFTTRSEGPDATGRALHSIVAHPLLPAVAAGEPRAAQIERWRELLGLGEPLFRLFWLPQETGSSLAELDWEAPSDGRPVERLRSGPRAVMAAITGLTSGRALYERSASLG